MAMKLRHTITPNTIPGRRRTVNIMVRIQLGDGCG
jgi:hypothetical protein